MRNRSLFKTLKKRSESSLGRILVLTGARQTGKTTLVKRVFPDYKYIALDDPVTRLQYTGLPASAWHNRYQQAVLDEIQKTPALMDSVKAVYDRFEDSRFVILGSSQILLLQRIKESLAGRADLVELYPLTLPEIATQNWDDPVSPSVLLEWLRKGVDLEVLPAVPADNDHFEKTSSAFERYLRVGGYPRLWKEDLSDADSERWLEQYVQTYLQRDVRDLADLRNLEPFTMTQQIAARLTGQQMNFAMLAKEAGVSPKTARRFLGYLEISYQAILLKPWHRNQLKRLTKSPKLHFLDPGVQAAVSHRKGALSGHEFESAVVAEIFKQIKNSQLNVDLYHLRTADGREVDLLVETEDGYYAFEIKMTRNAALSDARHLKGLGQILDKPLLFSFVLSNDLRIKHLEDGIAALPAALLLGSGD